MSQSANFNAIFVFGSRKVTPSTAKPTKPAPFTFSTSLHSKAERSSFRKPTSLRNPRRSTTPRVNPSPLPTRTEEKPEEQPETPLYKLQDVKAALEELEHLQTERDQSRDHEVRTAPLITREAYVAGGFAKMSMQYGVIGEALSIQSTFGVYEPVDPRLYINTNAPFSAVVCGVQGSGKSHTVSVLLENMFIPKLNSIGMLSKPLAGLVLHFGEGGPSSRPSEAAWVGVPSSANPNIKTPPVRVYVSKSSLNTMKAVYAPLGKHVKVMPLLFNESELDAEAFLSMMAVGHSESAPLYIQTVLSILRELGESFSYRGFLRRLEEKNFNPAQTAGLEQRLSLLDAFMDMRPLRPSSRFAAGELTIVDLSDPFIDPGSACRLFEIVTRLFVRSDVGTGKVLVVDEAHKYLSTNRGVAGLTTSLLTLTREQRHLGVRVLISTQEPTVIPPVLLDLCTVAIMHRFSSPAWWDHLARHVSADISTEQGFDKVVTLQTGEAIVLAPSGMGVFPDDSGTSQTTAGTDSAAAEGAPRKAPLTLGQFGRRLILMKTRARVTKDGGASILVVDSESESEASESD
ncbi:hypothetical protein JVT61DRAFT_8851 [Boletus reticuloceps]|uniref:Zona occludens toxin N-terminal domain-containing protein n=1 Tax=Boletus reticuloceps TaxID=495285 RepID=A0A8I2YGX4_9AGAM|nr:hypothetical protein JVT61DRAFT_8851 [Boletus reticuloceps]